MATGSIMIVEDNCIVAQDLAAFVAGIGMEVCGVCHTAEQALAVVAQRCPDLILMDIELDGAPEGVALADELAKQTGATVIFLSAHTDEKIVALAGQTAAEGFLLKPFDPQQLKTTVSMALARRSRGAKGLARAGVEEAAGPSGAANCTAGTEPFDGVIGSSPAITALLESVALVAPTEVGVLITGENGTGKELIAEALHKGSARSQGAFVAINCSAIPGPLLESALFGHSRGAFTGAHRDQEGFLERADGGTLFLDEIGDISHEIQVKLLRLLQSQEYHRVGDTAIRRANVRVIAATNRDLRELVAKGKIREDFFYRINVFPLEVPPLRERGDDVIAIAEHFRELFNRTFHKRVTGFSSEAIAALLHFHWPGNVRQLENAIKHAFVLAKGAHIELGHLPQELLYEQGESARIGVHGSTAPSIDPGFGTERERIVAALAKTGGHKGKAAMLLGYSRITLWKKLTKLGMASGAAPSAVVTEEPVRSQ